MSIIKNSEFRFLESIRSHCATLFDVGAHNDSIFRGESIEVHYFEPAKHLYDDLSKSSNINTKSFFNNFGLSDKEETLKYYYNTGSFIDRTNGPSRTYSEYTGLDLLVKRGDLYVDEKSITGIDFIKIDVEGFELKVFMGFGDKLNIVKFIQFEYGSAVADAGYRLIDMIEYLRNYNFDGFAYLNEGGGLLDITDYTDHWRWCNIVCYNKNLISEQDWLEVKNKNI
jgi:FkbM family methyltransferase